MKYFFEIGEFFCFTPRVPFVLLVGILRKVSALGNIVISLIAVEVVLGVALHPRDRDALARLLVELVDHGAVDVA